jgi:hypothetical protein
MNLANMNNNFINLNTRLINLNNKEIAREGEEREIETERVKGGESGRAGGTERDIQRDGEMKMKREVIDKNQERYQ